MSFSILNFILFSSLSQSGRRCTGKCFFYGQLCHRIGFLKVLKDLKYKYKYNYNNKYRKRLAYCWLCHRIGFLKVLTGSNLTVNFFLRYVLYFFCNRFVILYSLIWISFLALAMSSSSHWISKGLQQRLEIFLLGRLSFLTNKTTNFYKKYANAILCCISSRH